MSAECAQGTAAAGCCTLLATHEGFCAMLDVTRLALLFRSEIQCLVAALTPVLMHVVGEECPHVRDAGREDTL